MHTKKKKTTKEDEQRFEVAMNEAGTNTIKIEGMDTEMREREKTRRETIQKSR